MKSSVCCFSGYRPEKMPAELTQGSPAFEEMIRRLRLAVCSAAEKGCRHFLSGMSRGFDLWAAEVVLDLAKQGKPIDLWAAVAFPNMQEYWESEWQLRYNAVLQQSAHVFVSAPQYVPDCYTMRDRFLVDQSSRCICYFDGKAGGTQYTVRYAVRSGLPVVNLADPQLSLFAPV